MILAWTDDVIDAQPEASAETKEEKWEHDRHDEENDIELIASVRHRKERDEIDEKDNCFGRDDVDVDSPDEVALLTPVDQAAGGAALPYAEGGSIERGLPAGRTPQLQASNKHPLRFTGIHHPFRLDYTGLPSKERTETVHETTLNNTKREALSSVFVWRARVDRCPLSFILSSMSTGS